MVKKNKKKERRFLKLDEGENQVVCMSFEKGMRCVLLFDFQKGWFLVRQ